MPQNKKFFDLIIIDDIYPSTFSPFRTIEYNHYMWFFDAAMLSLEAWNLRIENNNLTEIKYSIKEQFRDRIFSFAKISEIGARLAYVTFLTNAYRLLPYFQAQNIPFILQLYPGGGFAIDIEEVDDELRAVLHDTLCVKVITTQINTRDYLINKINCDPQKIEFIFGGVFDSNVDFTFSKDKILFGGNKNTLDICFVAHKYGNDLSSKGYDYFVEVAKNLAPKFEMLKFHVVGEYSSADIRLGELEERFSFYGPRPPAFFAEFYPRMDAIISFNRPFTLLPGSFDGFPTGCCLEAGFRGVANILNDPLKLNIEFEDGRDIVILTDDFEASVSRIEGLLRDPAKLAALGENTCTAFRKVMSVDRQLWTRSKIIADQLCKHRSLVMVNVQHNSQLDRGSVPLVMQSLNQRVAQLESEIERWRSAAERRAARISRRSLRAIKRFLRNVTGRSERK